LYFMIISAFHFFLYLSSSHFPFTFTPLFFFLMPRRPPTSTLFPYNDALPISRFQRVGDGALARGFHPRDGHAVNEIFHGSEQGRSEEHTSELQSQSNLVCRLLLEKKKKKKKIQKEQK